MLNPLHFFTLSEAHPEYFKSKTEWRNWLNKNHADKKAIWLIIQKKASIKPGLRYEEAVLEAVAYGWIDGKMKRLNNYEFMQRFTPRRRGSVWSLSNRKRAEQLISEGRMTSAGLRTVENAKLNGHWNKAYSSRRGTLNLPDDLMEALKKNKTAYDNFTSFPPSTRLMYIYWINEAKRQDTRERRINTVVDRSVKNQRSGIDLTVSNKKLARVL
jgi:uncharacterized protein YdeI (YjbR/CyaY-like superfamily)